MAKPSTPTSQLLEAARLLEEELEQFAKLARAIEKEPLSSRKSLDRAGTSLAKIADSEDRLPAAMAALMGALNELRRRHEEQTEAVKRRAEEIRVRGELYRSLLERMSSVVAEASGINARLTDLSAGGRGKEELIADLDGVLLEIGRLTESSDALREEARELRFEDVGRQADGLGEQLGQARSKLSRLKKDLARS
jgi:chromosome segregation ATPase